MIFYECAIIGTLPSVKFACCGHGKEEDYIEFENGTVIRGNFTKIHKKKENKDFL